MSDEEEEQDDQTVARTGTPTHLCCDKLGRFAEGNLHGNRCESGNPLAGQITSISFVTIDGISFDEEIQAPRKSGQILGTLNESRGFH